MTNTTLRCQWCGLEGPPDDFELDTVHNDGFWCPDCDGHTYFDDRRNKQRRVLLILEDKDAPAPEAKRTKLRKRLSPFRYPGGKSKVIDFLAERFQAERLDTFVEAFAGGASVGLSLLDAGLTKRLVLCDTDPGVYAFWSQIVDDPSPILRRLETVTPNHAIFASAKAVLDEPKYWPRYELAWSQLVVNRLAFSGISKANELGGRNGSDKQLLARWNPKALKERIERIHEMADAIEVSNANAYDLIEQSAYWDEHSTLFIDPPYVAQGKALYRKYFDEDDHRDLAWLLESLYTGMPGADIVITYDDCELVRELYGFAEVVTIGRKYSI